MQATEVTPQRDETGKTREKSQKWEGTCFTCGRRTKHGFCNAVGTWNGHVKSPSLYCNAWEAK